MITKTQLINTLGQLPEILTIDDIVDHVLFLEKVQNGMVDSDQGKNHTKEEAKQKLKKWLKLSGLRIPWMNCKK